MPSKPRVRSPYWFEVGGGNEGGGAIAGPASISSHSKGPVDGRKFDRDRTNLSREPLSREREQERTPGIPGVLESLLDQEIPAGCAFDREVVSVAFELRRSAAGKAESGSEVG